MPDPAARFENLVASHLLKWVHLRVDTQGEDLELRYFRDSDDAPPAPGLRCLKARFARCEARRVSAAGAKDYETPEGLRVAPALALLRRLAQGRPCPGSTCAGRPRAAPRARFAPGGAAPG